MALLAISCADVSVGRVPTNGNAELMVVVGCQNTIASFPSASGAKTRPSSCSSHVVFGVVPWACQSGPGRSAANCQPLGLLVSTPLAWSPNRWVVVTHHVYKGAVFVATLLWAALLSQGRSQETWLGRGGDKKDKQPVSCTGGVAPVLRSIEFNMGKTRWMRASSWPGMRADGGRVTTPAWAGPVRAI